MNAEGFVPEGSTLERFVISNGEYFLHAIRVSVEKGRSTIFFKIFTPLGVIMLDRPPGLGPGPHPMGGGQLPYSSVHGNPLRLNHFVIYLEEWNCPRFCQDKTFQSVVAPPYRSLLPHRV